MDARFESLSRTLLEKREELRGRLGRISARYGTPLDRDSSEQALELENAEVLESLQREAHDELQRIEKTLELIEQDEYGTCIGCGMPIPVRRLEALPHACHCIECAGGGEKRTSR